MLDPIEMNSLLKHNHLDEKLLLRLHCAMLCSPLHSRAAAPYARMRPPAPSFVPLKCLYNMFC